jgi:hypothetical protein
MPNHRLPGGAWTEGRESPRALAATLQQGSDDEVLEAIFEGWEGTYGEGRGLLMGRVGDLRDQLGAPERSAAAHRLYRLFVTVGEEMGDMRFVHLAVESRDLLVYGY